MQHLDPTHKPLGRTTFLTIFQTMFNLMIDRIERLIDANSKEMAGLKWLSVGHDIWNTMIMDAVLGSLMKVMTREMEVYNIIAARSKHNSSY